MKTIQHILILMIFCVVFSSCATGIVTRQTYLDSSDHQFDDSKGYVYIFRKNHIFGAVRGLHVIEGGKKVCSLNPGNLFIYEINPGTYTFQAEDKIRKEEDLTITVMAGQKIYIEAKLRIGIIDMVPALKLVENENEINFSRLKPVAGSREK